MASSYYLYDKDVGKLLSVNKDTLAIEMQSPFNNQILERIYFQNAGQTNGSDNGFYMYIVKNGVKKYFTISPDRTYDPAVPDNKRYRLILLDAIETDLQLVKRQYWVFQLNLGYKGGYFNLFPTRIIRSNLALNFSHTNIREDHNVYISYDNTNQVNLVRADNLQPNDKLNCLILMDNRQFLITSQKANRLFLGAITSPTLSLSVITFDTMYWRLDPVDQNYHFWGGKYFILLPDTSMSNTSVIDNRLYADDTGVTINTSNDISRNSQWEFIYLYDAKSCLIKNVATGKILTINANDNGLTIEANYDATSANVNNADNKRKRWNITSANIPPTE